MRYDDLEMAEVIREFHGGYGAGRCSLIIQTGNLLATSVENGEKNTTAEFFLRNFLVEYLNEECFQSRLDLVAAGSADKKEKQHLVNEVLENCFVFLSACQSKVCRDTRWVLEAVSKKTPHPQFSRVVEEKIRASKLDKVDAAA